jgi:hypothetical protein
MSNVKFGLTLLGWAIVMAAAFPIIFCVVGLWFVVCLKAIAWMLGGDL